MPYPRTYPLGSWTCITIETRGSRTRPSTGRRGKREGSNRLSSRDISLTTLNCTLTQPDFVVPFISRLINSGQANFKLTLSSRAHGIKKMAVKGKFGKLKLGTSIISKHVCSLYSPDADTPSLYRFADALQPPDPFLNDDYVAKHRGMGTTIVIDNGLFNILNCTQFAVVACPVSR